jgi:hypothetical protein
METIKGIIHRCYITLMGPDSLLGDVTYNLFPKHISLAKGSSQSPDTELWWGIPATRWIKLFYWTKIRITFTENRSFVSR